MYQMHKSREENENSFVNSQEDKARERDWVLAAQDGDKDAYGRLVLNNQKRLFRFIFMMLGKRDMTEDIVQEAFVKGYLALGTFDVNKDFYPWIATIARNLAINELKKRSREKPVSEFEELMESVPDTSANPLNQILNNESDRKLAGAVQSLPEPYREVFVLRMIEKMSYDEIGKKLNISPGTVDSRLHRARQKLVELLKDFL